MKWTSSSLHLARKRARKTVIRKCVTTSVGKAWGKFWASWKKNKGHFIALEILLHNLFFHRTRFRTRYSAAFRYFTKILELNQKDFVLLEFCHISKILFIPTKMLENNGRSLQNFVVIILFQSTEWGMFKQCVETPYRQFVQVPLGWNGGYSDCFSLELTNCLVKCRFMTFTNFFGVTRQLIGQFWKHDSAVDIHGFVRCFRTFICYKCVPSWLDIRNHSRSIDGLHVKFNQGSQTWKQSGLSRDENCL